MAAPDDPDDSERDDELRQALDAILEDAREGELTREELDERLAEIAERHPRARFDARRAGRAVDALAKDAPSRHHELEQLAAALGVELSGD